MRSWLVGENAAAVAAAVSRLGRLPWIAAAGVMTSSRRLRCGRRGARRSRWTVRWCGWMSIWARMFRCLLPIEREQRRHLSRWNAAGLRLRQPRRSCSPGGSINRKPPSSRERRGQTAPFFSPDGQWIGFYVGGKLNKISVEGGAVVPLGDVDNFGGASWGEDGSIIVSEAFGKGLLRIPAGGGAARDRRGTGQAENLPSLARRFCPEAKRSCLRLYTGADVDKYTIEVLTLADRHRKIVARGGTSPRYLATSSGGRPFDLRQQGNAVRDPVRSGQAGDARDGRARSGRCRLSRARPGPVNLTSPGRPPGTALWSTAGPAAARPQ